MSIILDDISIILQSILHVQKHKKRTPGATTTCLAYGMPRLLFGRRRTGRLTFLGDLLQLLNHQCLRPPWRGPLARFPVLESPSGYAQGVSYTLLGEPGSLPGLFDRFHDRTPFSRWRGFRPRPCRYRFSYSASFSMMASVSSSDISYSFWMASRSFALHPPS